MTMELSGTEAYEPLIPQSIFWYVKINRATTKHCFHYHINCRLLVQ